VFLTVIELLGTIAFCISGVIVAHQNKMDGVGVIVLAAVTAVGGGTIRDIVLDLPVFWVYDVKYIYLILITSIAGILWINLSKALPEKMLELFDALGLALFSLTGLIKALEAGVSYEPALLMGIITGCFGGVIRDVLANTIPLLFQKELYALCTVLGCATYLVLLTLGVSETICFYTSFLVVFISRVLAVKYQLKVPVFKAD
jgi:uncharacterized membrane protein YeiH